MDRKKNGVFSPYTPGRTYSVYTGNEKKKGQKKRRSPRILIGILTAIVLVLLLMGLTQRLFGDRGRVGIGNIQKIGAMVSQNVYPFGDNVIFYDGMSIHCVSATGASVWSYQIGSNADYDIGENRIIAWTGNDLYILNDRGRLTYNNKMSDYIQFASVGREYAAAFVGTQDTGVVTVINENGQTVDNITIENQTLLDIGFFDAATTSSTQTTELMWTMGLITTGTVIETELQTFQPGRLLTGRTSLGDHIAYKVFDNNGILNIVTTREILHYNYRAVESESSSLIYGYTLEDIKRSGNTLYQLFLPNSDQSRSGTINSVRIMYGNVNRVIHLPGNCFGATLGSRGIYGFSENTIYACRFGDTTFQSYPLDIPINKVIGMITNNRAVVSSGVDIYVVDLPM
ncbi:MAG: hypothetical protein IJ719_21865 [Clostridia bacterium]|nr:hypothetical protein [Clostridia bacterium]